MTAWLLDTLIYTGLMIALVLVLRRPVSRHFGPQLAYALWGEALRPLGYAGGLLILAGVLAIATER